MAIQRFKVCLQNRWGRTKVYIVLPCLFVFLKGFSFLKKTHNKRHGLTVKLAQTMANQKFHE